MLLPWSRWEISATDQLGEDYERLWNERQTDRLEWAKCSHSGPEREVRGITPDICSRYAYRASLSIGHARLLSVTIL